MRNTDSLIEDAKAAVLALKSEGRTEITAEVQAKIDAIGMITVSVICNQDFYSKLIDFVDMCKEDEKKTKFYYWCAGYYNYCCKVAHYDDWQLITNHRIVHTFSL